MTIDPRTQGPSIDNQWSAYVLITRMGGSYAEVTEYFVPGRFKSKELGLAAALCLGKMKVDEILK